MNISKINNAQFKGLLTITGPDKKTGVTLNTANISTISQDNFIDTKEDSLLGIGRHQSAVISMNNGVNVTTFLPTETIIDAYKKAQNTEDYKVETKYNPVVTGKLLSI